MDNLVAMSSKTNRAGGQWYNMEKKWAEEAPYKIEGEPTVEKRDILNE